MSDFELPKQVEVKGKPTPTKTSAEAQGEKTDSNESGPQYDEVELAKIFDEIIFSGVYSEQVVIKGKLRVTLKTRNAEESEEISAKLDATPANLISTLNEKKALLNIYYSLTSYQGKDLSGMKQDDKEKFINRVPAPIVNAIVRALSRFDMKVYKACEDGESNF